MNSTTTLRYVQWWRWGGYFLILVVVYCSLAPRAPEMDMQHGDKLGHFLAYGSLMFWFAQLAPLLGERLRWAFAFVLMGITLEFLQGLTSYRSCDVLDMLANAAGVFLGGLLGALPQLRIFARLERLFAKTQRSS